MYFEEQLMNSTSLNDASIKDVPTSLQSLKLTRWNNILLKSIFDKSQPSKITSIKKHLLKEVLIKLILLNLQLSIVISWKDRVSS